MCSKDTITMALDEVRDGLSAIFGRKLQNVLLYGSYARGDQDEESDVDVLALVSLPMKELDAYEDATLDLSVAVGLRYDVLFSILLQDTETFTKYKKAVPFFQNVMREGISLVR